jgi:hypothetical protein
MDTLVESLLAYRANAPVIDQLLTEAGFTNHGNPVASLLGGAPAPAPRDGHAPPKDEKAPTTGS